MTTSSAERLLMRKRGGMRSCGLSWQTAHLCLYSSAPSGDGAAACCCWVNWLAEAAPLLGRRKTAGKMSAENRTTANKLTMRILLGAFIWSPDRNLLDPRFPSYTPCYRPYFLLKNVFFRRGAAPEFSRGFQPTGQSANIPTSRQRRLNSIVADATRNENHAHRGLKPTAKFKPPLRGEESRVRGRESRSLPFAEIGMMTNRGIQKSSLSSEHFRATYPAKADRQSIENMLRTFESARADLLRRLEAASLRLAEPGPFEVVVHSTTADFIAATGQGGWAAGATRGWRIELQPLDLLWWRGVLNATLRHEMTHEVIEALGGGRAPRWMAEGLAIYVAGEAASLQRTENKSRL